MSLESDQPSMSAANWLAFQAKARLINAEIMAEEAAGTAPPPELFSQKHLLLPPHEYQYLMLSEEWSVANWEPIVEKWEELEFWHLLVQIYLNIPQDQRWFQVLHRVAYRWLDDPDKAGMIRTMALSDQALQNLLEALTNVINDRNE
ncbi:MAG TPA: hypothetical protein VD999_04560 [Vitreimonas sp.]|nr:hypothetical protein [Vitreimonas sp.]